MSAKHDETSTFDGAEHPTITDPPPEVFAASERTIRALRTQLAEQATQLRELVESGEGIEQEIADLIRERDEALAQLEIRTAEREESRQTALTWKREALALREQLRTAELDAESLGRRLGEAQAQVAVLVRAGCWFVATFDAWQRGDALESALDEAVDILRANLPTPPQADTAPREGSE